jgi:carbamoyltransferase
LLYSAFTAWLGFRVNSGEYKVMGMAPYGSPNHLEKVEKLIRFAEDGSFQLNLDYFSYQFSLGDTYNDKFVDLFGPPRPPESPFNVGPAAGKEICEASRYYADVAASIQLVTEEAMLRIVREAHRRTGLSNLVMAGGVALNSVANGRIMRESPFEAVFIQPNAGDAGGALGAALYAYHVLLKQPREYVMEHAYWGAEYDADRTRLAINHTGLSATHFDDPERLVERVVDRLINQKVVGLAQGRFEWGPRALGNRSIIADPRSDAMRDVVNAKIKFRELFRPFAPVTLETEAPKYFELGRTEGQYPQRFMLMVSRVNADKEPTIPAVSHMGTGRLQTVRREWNPLYYDFIERFGAATGTPVLLNTSFNRRGEPIVNTPEEALATFLATDIDVLVLGDHLVEKG